MASVHVRSGMWSVVCGIAGAAMGWGGAVAFADGADADLDPMHSMTVEEAIAVDADAAHGVLPTTAPPYLTTFQYVQAEGDVRELRVQEGDFGAVLCAGPVGADTLCAEGTVLRDEMVDDLEVRIVLMEASAEGKVDVHLDADARAFVENYWKNVPLVSGVSPVWIEDLARLGAS